MPFRSRGCLLETCEPTTKTVLLFIPFCLPHTSISDRVRHSRATGAWRPAHFTLYEEALAITPASLPLFTTRFESTEAMEHFRTRSDPILSLLHAAMCTITSATSKRITFVTIRHCKQTIVRCTTDDGLFDVFSLHSSTSFGRDVFHPRA